MDGYLLSIDIWTGGTMFDNINKWREDLLFVLLTLENPQIKSRTDFSGFVSLSVCYITGTLLNTKVSGLVSLSFCPNFLHIYYKKLQCVSVCVRLQKCLSLLGERSKQAVGAKTQAACRA